MTKQTPAQPPAKGAIRLREFTRHEREAGIHPAIQALWSRPKMRGTENRRAVEYARIERGRMS